MSIFLYVVARAAIRNIHAHIFFIKQFSTPYILSTTKMGYCLTTLEIAINILTEEPDAIA